MRASVLIPSACFVLVLGCASNGGNTVVRVADYDQSCFVATDCVAVHDGSACDTCRCPSAFINTKEKARFDSAEVSAQQACGGIEVCNASCAAPQAACVASKCTACAGATCGSADAGTD